MIKPSKISPTSWKDSSSSSLRSISKDASLRQTAAAHSRELQDPSPPTSVKGLRICHHPRMCLGWETNMNLICILYIHARVRATHLFAELVVLSQRVWLINYWFVCFMYVLGVFVFNVVEVPYIYIYYIITVVRSSVLWVAAASLSATSWLIG